jgi:sialic acid synthase SpsE
MSQIVLDFSSGNTCRNDPSYIKRMIDELKAVDTGKHEVIIKWQLFEKAGDNIPLERKAFSYAYAYAKTLGYRTTASVFDGFSLHALMPYDVPFIKIANNRKLDHLIGLIPRRFPVYVSVGSWTERASLHQYSDVTAMFCVSKYPANIEEYEKTFSAFALRSNVSDHTIGLELFNKYKPDIWECHYKLDDSTGLDAGAFSKTPRELAEVL